MKTRHSQILDELVPRLFRSANPYPDGQAWCDWNGGRQVPASHRQSHSSVDDQSKALVLEPDELPNGGGNQQATGNEMSLDFCHDLIHALLVCILLTGGDLTGLPMNRLVSYEEQNAAALQSFDAGV